MHKVLLQYDFFVEVRCICPWVKGRISLGSDISSQKNQSNTNFFTNALCLHSRVGQVFLRGKTVEKRFKGISNKPLPYDFLRIINIEERWLSKTDTTTFHFVKCTNEDSASPEGVVQFGLVFFFPGDDKGYLSKIWLLSHFQSLISLVHMAEHSEFSNWKNIYHPKNDL